MPRWAVAVVAAALVGGTIAVLLARGDGASMPAPAPSTLLRRGTEATFMRVADLDGDGIGEAILAARSLARPRFGFPAQFLDIYAYRGGGWHRLLDGREEAPPGAGAPRTMLDPAGTGFANRLVDSVLVVDLSGDGAPELVVGILTAGAGPGPLELWILSAPEGSLRTELYERTTRGGDLAVRRDRLLFEFGVYGPVDPGCCPSLIERQVIGADPRTGKIRVLQRTQRRTVP